MKVIIEFDGIEERNEAEIALKAVFVSIALGEIKDMFRTYLKYDDSLSSEQYAILEKACDKFIAILEDNNILHLAE